MHCRDFPNTLYSQRWLWKLMVQKAGPSPANVVTYGYFGPKSEAESIKAASSGL